MFREEENFPFSFGTWSLKGCFVALKSVFAVTLREQGWTADVSPSCWCPRGWRSWKVWTTRVTTTLGGWCRGSLWKVGTSCSYWWCGSWIWEGEGLINPLRSSPEEANSNDCKSVQGQV